MTVTYGSVDGTREVVLTFDDGPHPQRTPRILDTLAERGVRAIFFVLGERLESERGREIMRRAFEEGHVIGNHTYSHPALTKLTDDEVREEIRRTQDLIGDCCGETRLFRPPYGATNARVDEIIREEGFLKVMWSVDTLDWKNRSSEWVDHAMDQIESREDSLVLMHDIHQSTADNVSHLLDRIEAEEGDFRFVQYA